MSNPSVNYPPVPPYTTSSYNQLVQNQLIVEGHIAFNSPDIYANAPTNAPRTLALGSDGSVGTTSGGGGGGSVTSLTASGAGITLSPSTITTTGTIANSGVTSLAAGANVTVSTSTGAVTVSAPNPLNQVFPAPTGGAGTQGSPFTHSDNTGGIQTQVTALNASGSRGAVNIGGSMYSISTPIILTLSYVDLTGINPSWDQYTEALATSQYGNAIINTSTSNAAAISIQASGSGGYHINLDSICVYQATDRTSQSGPNSWYTNAGIVVTSSGVGLDQSHWDNFACIWSSAGVVIKSGAVIDTIIISRGNLDHNGYGFIAESGNAMANTKIDRTNFADCVYCALVLDAPSGNNYAQNKLINCQFANSHTSSTNPDGYPVCGVYVNQVLCTITGNTFIGNRGAGLWINNTMGLNYGQFVVSDNIFRLNSGTQLHIQQAFFMRFSNNQLECSGANGITIDNNGAYMVDLIGNIILNDTGSDTGITLTGASSGSTINEVLIDGGRIYQFAVGISIGQNVTNVTVGPTVRFVSNTIDVEIAAGATGTVVHLQPNMKITDNGTSTTYFGALGTSSTGLLASGLSNKAVISGSPVTPIYL